MNLNKPHKNINIKEIGDSGFTLIEVLVAFAIFAVGFLAVSLMQLNALNGTNSARRATEAFAVADNQVEWLRSLPFYDSDADLDGDGNIDPFDILPALDSANDPHSRDADGPYTVRWAIIPDEPLPGYPANVLDPLPVSNSMIIRVWATRDNDPPDAVLAEITFGKTYSMDF